MPSTSEPAAPRAIGFSITSLDPKFSANPHAILDELREEAPIVFDAQLERWVLTRAAEVEAVLRDRDLSVDNRKAPEGSFARRFTAGREEEDVAPSMLGLDPPDHDRLRGLVNKAFTPKAVDRMAPRIKAIAQGLLDRVAGQPGFDVIADFSAPLPTIVIAEMLGIDAGDQKKFKAWSDRLIQGFNPFMTAAQREAQMASGNELRAYLRAAVETRRTDRRDDLVSAMIDAEEDGQQLTDEEIVTMVTLLLLAGNLTTTDLIGNGVAALLSHPGELEKLRNDPGLIRNAVEEMLRYDPPVTQSGRLALEDTEVGGCSVHAGSSISPVLLAANHDPAFNPDPHRFDIARENIQHTSFGGGRRYCLGAPLARLEAQIGIDALVQRFPRLRLAEGPLKWKAVPVFRGLESLPVRTD